ncbi:MAG: hypothetical protein JKY80_01960 [Mariprofundaceae bacterium]|nr:hypothetical protein [Methylophaga sp.]MBL4759605.1 hypothetical protein [Mariprofundaceae bacterium]
MIVSRLDIGGDWTFGKGRANYATKSEAIGQSVVTRLRSFTDDWFADIDHGIPWIELLGAKNTRDRILAEIEQSVLNTDGVRSIELLRINSVDIHRRASISIRVIDIYDQRIDKTVSVTP